jgi:hypothetical protein
MRFHRDRSGPILAGTVVLAGILALGGHEALADQAAAAEYPLTLTAEAVARSGRTTLTSTITIQVDAPSTSFNRTRVTDGLKYGGYAGALKALRGAPSVGSIDADSGKVTIRYAVDEKTEKGRRLVLVADRPLFFFAMGPESKSRAGYELTVVELLLDEAGVGTGTIAGAARVKPSPETGVVLDDYASVLVQLKVGPPHP